MRIGDTEYQTCPIKSVNLRNLCKYVYPTKIGFRRCPLCYRRIRRDYVYAVCISKTECIKTQGVMCQHCDAFFSMSYKLFEELEHIRTARSQYELRRDFLGDYDPKKYFKYATEISSAYRQVTLCRPGEYRTYTIVIDDKDCSIENGVIHYTNIFAREMLKAYILDRPTVLIEGKKYCIVKEKSCRSSFQSRVPYISPKTIVGIRTEKNGGLFDADDHHVLVSALAFFPKKNMLIPVTATYDTQRDMYIIDHRVLQRYAERYGLMLCKYARITKKGERFLTLNDESLLHQFGYTVNQTDNLPAGERQRILSMVMESGIMTPSEIINLLEFLIRRNGNLPGNMLAKMKWQEDLEYVYNYRIEPKGFVIGTMREL